MIAFTQQELQTSFFKNTCFPFISSNSLYSPDCTSRHQSRGYINSCRLQIQHCDFGFSRRT
ncbi:unnamed protein product [Paramecium octaurelia]|uniref:Uncharacterized protein n=1 Tax=Paramecium octaurelia TaxID=43137 RepID=A0A8S1U2N8_PAROT|nr:unnamed protein product [Paramecium octaurelia]